MAELTFKQMSERGISYDLFKKYSDAKMKRMNLRIRLVSIPRWYELFQKRCV